MAKRGDRSIKFFYRVANSHRRTNTIKRMNIDGMTCFEAPLIREHVFEFLKNLLTKQVGRHPKLDDGLGFESIEPH